MSNDEIVKIARQDCFLSQRYLGAQTEINARLLSRQIAYAFAAVIMVSTSISLVALTAQDSNPIIQFACLLPVLIAWPFSFWSRHNDAIIGLLSAYCKACETFIDANNILGIPAWHMDGQEWIREARKYRRFSDYGLIGMFCVGIFPSIYLLMHGLIRLINGINDWYWVLHLTIVIAMFFPCWYVWSNAEVRRKLTRTIFEPRAGAGWRASILDSSPY